MKMVANEYVKSVWDSWFGCCFMGSSHKIKDMKKEGMIIDENLVR